MVHVIRGEFYKVGAGKLLDSFDGGNVVCNQDGNNIEHITTIVLEYNHVFFTKFTYPFAVPPSFEHV